MTNVLVVEDDDRMRHIMSELFETYGLRLIPAQNTVKAEQILAWDETIKIVVLDGNLTPERKASSTPDTLPLACKLLQEDYTVYAVSNNHHHQHALSNAGCVISTKHEVAKLIAAYLHVKGCSDSWESKSLRQKA